MNAIHAKPRDLFSLNLLTAVTIGTRLASKKPQSATHLARTVKNSGARNLIRNQFEEKGLIVPPLAIISITRHCNLNCSGCYSKAVHQGSIREMTSADFQRLVGEAEALGISTILLAGGEPLMRQDLLDVASGFPDTLFIVFTNGTLLDNRAVSFFQTHGNIIPVISLEGDEDITDARRGTGIHAATEKAMAALNEARSVFGVSITRYLRQPRYGCIR